VKKGGGRRAKKEPGSVQKSTLNQGDLRGGGGPDGHLQKKALENLTQQQKKTTGSTQQQPSEGDPLKKLPIERRKITLNVTTKVPEGSPQRPSTEAERRKGH